MTFVHFINCMALAYAPYVVTYKTSILSEYNAIFRMAFAGFVYTFTQLGKMLALATFFPSFESEGPESMNYINEILKTTVDLADLAGIYFIINRTVGKPELKVMIAGVGWAGTQVLFSNLIPFWFGARSQEFDWKYLQMAIDANITLAHVLSVAVLVWVWTRTDLNKALVPMVSFMLVACVFRSLIVDFISDVMMLNAWSTLLLKGLTTFISACFSLQLYVGFTDFS